MKELDWTFEEEEFDNTPPLKKGDIIRRWGKYRWGKYYIKVSKVTSYGASWTFKSENGFWYIYDEKKMKIIKY